MLTVTVCKRTRSAGQQTKTWYLRWQCPLSGKRMYVTTGSTRKSIAEELAKAKQEELERIAAGIYDPNADKKRSTFAEAKDAWLSSIEARNKPGTYENYGRSLKYFEEICSPKSVAHVGLTHIEKFVAELKKSAKPVTINKHLRHIKAFLRWCVEAGYGNTIPRMKMLTVAKNPKVRIPKDKQVKLLEAIADSNCGIAKRSRDWWRVWTQVLFYSGCRRTELLKLRWKDLDFTAGLMLIDGNHEKTSRYRLIPLSSEIKAVLQAWRGDASDADLVFPLGGQSVRTVYGDWMRIREFAGIDSVNFKNARSTAGSEIYATQGIGAAQDWLGHSTPVITKEYYADNAETLRIVAEARHVIGTAT